VSARKPRSSVLVVLLLGFAGCATLLPAPREPIGREARQVIERLDARWREFGSLRTLVDLVVQRSGQRHQLRGVLLAKGPTSLRFEALSPMGHPLLLATIHEGRFIAYDATTNNAYRGPASREVITRILQLPLEVDDLVGIVAGRPTVPADVRAATLHPPDEVGPSIELVGATNRRRIWFDPERALVRQFELTGGRAEVRVRYQRGNPGEVNGFDLTTTPAVVAAIVRYDNPAFDAALLPGAFELTIPNGAKIQDIR
jgi:outer membrane lipoprotein-sorting protein